MGPSTNSDSGGQDWDQRRSVGSGISRQKDLQFDLEGLARAKSAYLHVPFCQHKCGYCNFTVAAKRPDLVPAYLQSIKDELARELVEPRSMLTVFLGGGTPSYLSFRDLECLLSTIRHWLPLLPEGEFSCEVNPIDCDLEKLQLLHEMGVNRISIGGQSFSNRKLQILERDHSGDMLRKAIETCRQVFENVSLDLIFAVPGETLEEWSTDLETLLQSGVTHASTYGLTIERGSTFYGRVLKEEMSEVESEMQCELLEHSIAALQAAGWEHYEVSSFAARRSANLRREAGLRADGSATRPTWRCRHNEAYWLGETWNAFGPGAASFLVKDAPEITSHPFVRQVNHRSTLAYLRRVQRGESPIAERDELSSEDYLRERLVFGLRRIEGIYLNQLSSMAKCSVVEYFEPYLSRYIQQGWLQLDRETSRLSLTPAGLMISDSLWPDLLAPNRTWSAAE